MRMEKQVEEIHNNNLQGISSLRFINDQLRMLMKIVGEKLSTSKSRATLDQRFKELESQVKNLKSRIIKEDSELLSTLCAGQIIPKEDLINTCKSPAEVKSISQKFRMLKKEVKELLLGNKPR